MRWVVLSIRLTWASSTVEQKSAERDTQPSEKTLAYHKEALDLIPALGREANMKQKYHLSPDVENHKIGHKVFFKPFSLGRLVT